MEELCKKAKILDVSGYEKEKRTVFPVDKMLKVDINLKSFIDNVIRINALRKTNT